MNLEFSIDKDTNFYYWVQAVSGWNPHAVAPVTQRYYTDIASQMSEECRKNADAIKTTLEKSKNSFGVLAELYTGSIKSDEAKNMIKLSKPLEPIFTPSWSSHLPYLEQSLALLEKTDFNKFNKSIKTIKHFFNSSIDLNKPCKVYLLQNPVKLFAGGHAISKTDFVLIRPLLNNKTISGDTFNTIAHEYVHKIEQKSTISRKLFKKSFDTHLANYDLPHPPGYSWKSMYVEIFTYSFANNIAGGYLGPKICPKSRNSVDEMKEKFWKMVREKRHNTTHVIAWVALSILPDIKAYMAEEKQLDQGIVDKASLILREFYI